MKGCCKLTSLLLLLLPAVALAAEKNKEVLVMEVRAEIDPRMSRYVELALAEASRRNVSAVIVDMDTYGGAVDDADKIRTMLLEYDKPVYVFINKNAASAGALISIACDSIYMEAGSNIGAATVVTGDGKAAPDKYQSYMRSMMRSTAEANGRDPGLAEQMVDENLSFDTLTKKGKVLTMTTSEAIEKGFCEAQVESIEEVLMRTGLNGASVYRYKLDWDDRIISFFLNPFISSILVLIIIGGIYYELQTPGIGFPIAASIVAAVLYFTPYYLNGLAANWEIILFFIGLLLLGLEVFVIPGFGIAGISGLILCSASLVLVMLNNRDFDFSFVDGERLLTAVLVLCSGLFGGVLLLFFGGMSLANSPFMRRVSLAGTQASSEGYSANQLPAELVGKKGVAETPLRPSGKVSINGQFYDAYSRGEYIEKGSEVEVLEVGVNSLKVKA